MLVLISNSDEVGFFADSPPSADLVENRLTIAHLLLWTTTTAIVVAIARLDLISQLDANQPLTARDTFRQWAMCSLIIAIAPIIGSGIAAVALSAHRRLVNGPSFPSQPGHWLLFVMGIISLTGLTLFLTSQIIPSPSPLMESFELFFAIAQVVSVVGSAGILVWITNDKSIPLRWRTCLRVVAASLVAFVTCFCCLPIHGPWWFALPAIAFYLGAPVTVVTACARDFLAHERYDIYHWTGAIAWPLLSLAWFAMIWFSFF